MDLPGAAPPLLPLGEMAVVGLRHHAAPGLLPSLAEGATLRLMREPWNRRDPDAVAVMTADGARRGLPAAQRERMGGAAA